MATETNSDLSYITSCKRLRLNPPPFMDLPPLPIQSTTSLYDDDHLRFLQSQAASTSTARAVATPINNDHLFSSYINHSNMSVPLEETWRRHVRGLLLAIRQQVIARLIEKESELEHAKRRNNQLEEELTQISAEIYVWFDAAKNNEAVASALQMKLDEAITSIAEGSSSSNRHDAEDAQSCCFEGSEHDVADMVRNRSRICRGCGGKEACMLLLPCRHLCLCKECEPMAATCPLCCSAKNASLEIIRC
ncbi:SBP (S-ribonuclease binding protein) family protein [Rhynchospora pubera]|uniref:SBP (S-ribonuclease binding protein) family protein n=1 Tax=Rhynchospora pubera TaxID=906938 RepID=A0AAV8HBA5_9POAL|nr:SBP (S-ribonuclease binding protein) family protein [Rhynchospora pubera]